MLSTLSISHSLPMSLLLAWLLVIPIAILAMMSRQKAIKYHFISTRGVCGAGGADALGPLWMATLSSYCLSAPAYFFSVGVENKHEPRALAKRVRATSH